MADSTLDHRMTDVLNAWPAAGGEHNTRLRVVPTDLLTDHTPPAHVIERIVPRGVVTLLGGHGGTGKSVLALTLAAHVATGRSWSGLSIEQGDVLFVSLEDPGSLVNFRLRRIAEAYNLNANLIAERLLILDGSDADASLVGEVREDGVTRLGFTTAFAELEKGSQGRALIVVDNASDGFDANENDRRSVRGFMRGLAQVARSNDAGLILLAHIDKVAARHGGQGNNYSGSTGWHNGSRSRLALIVGDDGVELRHEKANLTRAMPDPLNLFWTDNGVLMPTGVNASTGHQRDDTGSVLSALQAAWAAGDDVSAARTGSTTSQAVLSTFEELPKHLRGSTGRSAFWTAMGKLQSSGAVETQEIVTLSRHKKRVLVAGRCAGSESVRADSPHPYAALPRTGVAGVRAGSAQVPNNEPAQTGANADSYQKASQGE